MTAAYKLAAILAANVIGFGRRTRRRRGPDAAGHAGLMKRDPAQGRRTPHAITLASFRPSLCSIPASERESEVGERALRLLAEVARRRLEALDVDAERRPDRARTGSRWTISEPLAPVGRETSMF